MSIVVDLVSLVGLAEKAGETAPDLRVYVDDRCGLGILLLIVLSNGEVAVFDVNKAILCSDHTDWSDKFYLVLDLCRHVRG